MLLIDKTQLYSKIVVTVSELALADSPTYVLILKSAYSNISHKITLYLNISNHMKRYDEFIISTMDVEAVEEGMYTYYICEYEGVEIDVSAPFVFVEMGYLKVKGSDAVDSYYSLPSIETEDDYVIYKND